MKPRRSFLAFFRPSARAEAPAAAPAVEPRRRRDPVRATRVRLDTIENMELELDLEALVRAADHDPRPPCRVGSCPERVHAEGSACPYHLALETLPA